jgi:hypothetical protein
LGVGAVALMLVLLMLFGSQDVGEDVARKTVFPRLIRHDSLTESDDEMVSHMVSSLKKNI